MKSHWRSISPENPFNFIKIILSDDTQSRGIRLPQKFTEEYGKYLSESVTLKVPNGDVWQVEVQKTGDEIWLKNGWGRFAEHYGLGLAHLLMFEYDGLSTFGVIIFNATASEIKYPKNTDRNAGKCHVSCDEQETVILDDDDDDHMCSSSEDGKNEVKINGWYNLISDEGECSRKRQGGGRKQALEKAKENFKSDLPFFMVYMSTSYLTNRGVVA
ncbi:hypothetical protein QVD17_36792 [Tagetes erecta]|uniref:TF-B3 domain-containing protein n=1 Tax=Tagetes erecta TaxID=13708 RepID=A0AAD8JTC7_TARER|nr:hypothetical protein QVD17_36792 [Tagetes erecta]